MFVLCERGARAPGLESERENTYRPVVRLIRLHGDGRALALGEVVRIVHVLEAARADDGVDMAADLHTCTATESRQVRARTQSGCDLSQNSKHRVIEQGAPRSG